jgi:hypothetical protein
MEHKPQEEWLPPDLLKAIGALIVTSSTVDQQVGFQIVRLISPLDFVIFHAFPIVAGMDFRVKLTILRALAAAHGKEILADISECCDEMQKIYEHRNRLSHGVFSGLTRSGRARFQSLKPDPNTGVPPQPFVVSAAQISEWGHQLFIWSNELEQRLCDLGIPYQGPKLSDVAKGPLEPLKEDSRPKSLAPRPKRKKPSSQSQPSRA